MKLEHMLRRLLFPSRCMLCGMVLEGDRQLCPACMERAVLQSGPARRGPEEHYDGAAAALRYEGAVRQAIHGLKYREKQSYARPLARIMKEIALRQLREDFDLVTFVPSNPGTERKRGYNQSRLLAEELARLLERPCRETLRKQRETQPMFGLSPKARRENHPRRLCALLSAGAAGREDRFGSGRCAYHRCDAFGMCPDAEEKRCRPRLRHLRCRGQRRRRPVNFRKI